MVGDESTSFARTESHVHIGEEVIVSGERIAADSDDVVAASADDDAVVKLDYIANCIGNILNVAVGNSEKRQLEINLAEAVRTAASQGEEAAHQFLKFLAELYKANKETHGGADEKESFALTLTDRCQTHSEWLAVVRYGMGTLLEDQRILMEVITREAMCELERAKGRTPVPYYRVVCGILQELNLHLEVCGRPKL